MRPGSIRWTSRGAAGAVDRRGWNPVARAVGLVGLSAAVAVAPLSAQTIRGRLMDDADDRPVALGLVLLSTLQGDSVGAALTDDDGDFEVRAEDPGSFFLTAAALGYRERTAGVFELGEGGRMTVEFRIERQPLTLEGIVVHADRYASQPALVRNGFYRRMQRGLGHFLTPEDVDRSPALSTSDLLYGVPGVRVRPGGGPGDDRVTVRGTGGDYCDPVVFIDGVRVEIAGGRLEDIIPRAEVSAVEVHGGVAGVPIEYGGFTTCGVLLFWTRS